MKRKRWTAAASCFCAAILFCVILSARARAASAPSLFYDDERWYRDAAAGLVVKDGVYYVPVDIFGMFSELQLRIDAGAGEFMIYNRTTGAYITVLTGENLATVNGAEEVTIVTFRHGGCDYVDAAFFCSVLSMEMEVSPSAAPDGVSLRICSGWQTRTLAELLASYATSELPPVSSDSLQTVTEPPITSSIDMTARQIYLTFNTFTPSMFVRILDVLDGAGVSATFFLTEEELREMPEIVVSLAAREHAVALIVPVTATCGEFLEAADAANARLYALTMRKTRIVQAAGGTQSSGFGEAELQRIEEAGYCLWDWTYDVPDGAGYPYETVSRLCREQLLLEEVCVFRFGGSYITSLVLPELLDFITVNPSYTLRTIGECADAVRFFVP